MFQSPFKNALIAISIIAASTPALAENISIKTRFGTLTTDSNFQVQYNGKKLSPAVDIVSSAYILSTYKLKNSDVILVSQADGNACPGQYAFIVVTADGAHATPPFGTCYDDDIKPTRSGESISFSMKKLEGKGSVQYKYERGTVFENGKPVR